MILWTIQDARVMDVLERDGVYAVDPEHLEFPESEDNHVNHCNHAYKWLCYEMERRVGPPPEGVEYPIWAYYKEQGRHDGKPDMRTYHRCSKADEVRLLLDVPDWEVLLSDYDAWHFALNYWYLPEDRADGDRFDTVLADADVTMSDVQDWSKGGEVLRGLRSAVEDSWERCLGVRPLVDFWGNSWEMRTIQATFWQLRMEHVVSVEYFRARRG